MKKISLMIVALFGVCLISKAQDYNPELYGPGTVPFVDGRVVFTSVKNVENVSADQLYAQLKMYIADTFKSSTDVTKLDDDANKTMIVKGFSEYNEIKGMTALKCNVWYTIKLQAKDGRYKIDVYDMTIIIPADRIGSTIIPESKSAAELLTDDNCLSKGVVKKTGYGFQRRAAINTANRIFSSINNYLTKAGSEKESDW